jgi:hypothetical protein
MPSPKSRIHELEKQLQDKPPRSREQREVSRVLRHPRFQDALEDFDQNRARRNQAAANPAGHLRGRGVPLPLDMTVDLVPDNWSITICIRFICGGYDSDRGWWVGW